MSNALLTPTMITREALRILHQKLNFVKTVQRQYDDRFAKAGAKIGQILQIRKPNRYTVSTGASLSPQDTTEQKVDLTVSTQKHVDTTFSSVELTMSLDDFSKRILEPGMAQLASAIEADALNMYQQVYEQTGSATSPINALTPVLQARKRLNNNLTPMDGARTALLNTDANVTLVDALKGLFHSSSEITEQYEEGTMGKTAGFTFRENTLIPTHTPGSWGTTPLVDGASQTGATLNVKGLTATTGTIKKGDVFTLGGVYGVHPETKQSFGYLQKFVATADLTADSAGKGALSISPSIVTSGALQTVSGSPADGATITYDGTASTAYGLSLLYHKDAFAFATADLEDVSQYGAWGAREVYDGISMRIARQYAIGTDTVPCRIDVLYGYVATYPQLACRMANLPSTS